MMVLLVASIIALPITVGLILLDKWLNRTEVIFTLEDDGK